MTAGRALITGSQGFVGRALSAHLRSRGWEVAGCDMSVQPGTPGEIACDIRDPRQVRVMLDSAGRVTHIFHLAAMAFVPDTVRDPPAAMQVNLVATIELLIAWRLMAPDARFIFVSTGEIYGAPRYLPMDEDHPIDPRNPYALSKAAADLHCRWYSQQHAADVVRLRPFNHAGPGQLGRYALPSFARQIAEIEQGKREPEIRVGNLDASRDFMHVSDTVRAYELAALYGKPGEVYNVCSGRSVVMRQALEALIARSRVRPAIHVDPNLHRAVEAPEIRGSYARLHADTGWAPEIPFENLVEDLLTYWRAEVAAAA